MRARILVVSVVLLAACGGVLFNQSNAFPCDFSQAPGVRDGVCAAGDVCGVDNRCQRYVNEGPRFEGAATLPDFSVDAGGGKVLHPLMLTEAAAVVAPLPRRFPREDNGTWVATVNSSSRAVDAFAVQSDGRVDRSALPEVPAVFSVVTPVQIVPLHLAPVTSKPELAAVVTDKGALVILKDAVALADRLVYPPLDAGVSQPRVAGPVRVVAPTQRSSALAFTTTAPAQAQFVHVSSDDVATARTAKPDGGAPLDVAWVSRRDLLAALVLTPEAFWLWGDPLLTGPGEPASPPGLERISPEDTAFPGAADVRVDVTGSLVAATFDLASDAGVLKGRARGLSTWQLTSTGGSWSLRRLWSDCSPCPQPAALVTSTPIVTDRGAAVDALCSMRDTLTLVRVTGSAAGDATQACVMERLDLPLDPSLLVDKSRPTPLQDQTQSAGVVVAGTAGQLWSGDSLGSLLPAWLERVPLDVDVVDVGHPRSPSGRMVALTSRYLARTPFTALPGRNGFTRIGFKGKLAYLGGIDMPAALVRGGQGWVLLPTGDLAQMQEPSNAEALSNAEPDLRFGPRLVDGNGQPLTTALGGVAITAMDGGVLSAVVASGDSLSFVPLTAPTTDAPGQLGDVSPQLTPEPGNRIRSFAVEMTPIGTNGVDRVRGYLVTSRNLYRFELSGSPPRWSATPLVLSGGEPLETWMDNPRGGLGRVGYRDGRVFTLPGGFQLVEALGAVDGGAPPQVLDYENLGGWPVASTSMGLYVARWDTTDTGALVSRFADGGVNRPMTWRKVTLPDGKQPWMHGGEARPAKLFVKADPQVQEGSLYSQTFTLMLFLDDEVLQVGQHVRTNKSTRVE